MLVLLLFFFIWGAALGSFISAFIDRSARGESIIYGRSKCVSCGKKIENRDLIPLVSYILLRGRCRKCHAKIPPILFITELLVGTATSLFCFYSIHHGLGIVSGVLIYLILLSLIGIFIADLVYGIIPDEFVVSIAVFNFLLVLNGNTALLVPNILVGVAIFSFFLALYLITRGRGMGFGDVKLSFALGFFLGFPQVIVSLYVAFLTATVVSLILVFRGKKKMRGGTIAFGPFLVLGTLISYLFGSQIIYLIFK